MVDGRGHGFEANCFRCTCRGWKREREQGNEASLHLPGVLTWWTVLPRTPFPIPIHAIVVLSFFHFPPTLGTPTSTRQRHQRSRLETREPIAIARGQGLILVIISIPAAQLPSTGPSIDFQHRSLPRLAGRHRIASHRHPTLGESHHRGTSTAGSRRNSSSKSPVEIVTKSPVIPNPTPRQSWAAIRQLPLQGH